MAEPPPPPTLTTRRDLEARIIAKAWRDPRYKDRLLKDPKAVLQDEVSAVDPSVTVPGALQVHVHEESPDVYHLVLPRNPRDISLAELADDKLEAVVHQTGAVVSAVNANVVVNNATVSVINVVVGPVTVVGPVAVVTSINQSAAAVVSNVI